MFHEGQEQIYRRNKGNIRRTKDKCYPNYVVDVRCIYTFIDHLSLTFIPCFKRKEAKYT